MNILVAGATGFVGSGLVPALLRDGKKVRCLVRKPADQARFRGMGAEVVLGDVLAPESLGKAAAGMDAAYFLVHQMASQPLGNGRPFTDLEMEGVGHFLDACRTQGVGRVIFVSGLVSSPTVCSIHLQSRWRVEEAIRTSGIPFTIFRAAVIIGRGSGIFEAVLQFLRHSPIVPWVPGLPFRMEPIALGDLIAYMVKSLDEPQTVNRTFDVGCGESMTTNELVDAMIRELGITRIRVPIPFFSVRWLIPLAARWSGISRDLLESMYHFIGEDIVCHERSVREVLPIPMTPIRESLTLALIKTSS